MRGKGEGSVWHDKKRGYWVAEITLKPQPGLKRAPRKVIRRRNKKDLLDALEVMRAELKKNGNIHTDRTTVEEWMTLWLNTIAAADVRPKTLSNYRSMAKNWVIPYIGTVQLSRLTTQHIRTIHDAVLAKRSSTTALTVHAMLSSALAAAERDGRILRNPAELVKRPRRNLPDRESLTIEEAGKLIAAFAGTEQAYLWATFLLTGARRGEILGLEWDRVDDVLDLSWQLQRHPVNMVAPADYEYRQIYGGLYLTRPKSKAGTRAVPLIEPLKGILDAWRASAPPNPYNLVFTTAEGRPIDPDYATHWWPEVLKAAGIDKHVVLHGLRHSAIDLMFEAGVDPDTIRAVVGHSNLMMTRAYRSKIEKARLAKAMQPFTELLSRPADPDTPQAISA